MQEQKVRFVTKKLGGLVAEKGSNLLSSPCVEPPAVVQSCAAKAILASVSDGGDSLSSEPPVQAHLCGRLTPPVAARCSETIPWGSPVLGKHLFFPVADLAGDLHVHCHVWEEAGASQVRVYRGGIPDGKP